MKTTATWTIRQNARGACVLVAYEAAHPETGIAHRVAEVYVRSRKVGDAAGKTALRLIRARANIQGLPVAPEEWARQLNEIAQEQANTLLLENALPGAELLFAEGEAVAWRPFDRQSLLRIAVNQPEIFDLIEAHSGVPDLPKDAFKETRYWADQVLIEPYLPSL